MLQYSDGDDQPSESVSSDTTDENILIPQIPQSTESYFIESFTPKKPLSKSDAGADTNPTPITSPNPNTDSVSSRNSTAEEKKKMLKASQPNTGIRLSQLSKATGTSAESNQQDPCSPDSSRTISTSVLLYPSEVNHSNSKEKSRIETSDDNRSSYHRRSYFSSEAEQSQIINEHSLTIEQRNAGNFEEAVKLLQQEAEENDIRIFPSNPISSGDDFQPHEYNIIKKASKTSLKVDTALAQIPLPKRVDKPAQSPSLLNKILVPSSENDTKIEIPALRAVSGSVNASPKVATLETFDATAPIAPERARIKKITRISDSQIDLAVNLLQEYRTDIHAYSNDIDLEANGNAVAKKVSMAGSSSRAPSIIPMPIQHINSSSIHSFDSGKSQFYEIYSVPRILGILICCFIVPPLFFMISVGSKGGISDYRLMRMLMNQSHRIGMLKGFIWDVDVGWFRNICFVLGVIETLGILACIGSGIGIGIRNLSR